MYMDFEAKSRARMRFQHSLYGKFVGKAPRFDQVKMSLQAKWSDVEIIHIFDLSNDCLLIRCETHDANQKLLFDGPCTINRIILQLSLLHLSLN